MAKLAKKKPVQSYVTEDEFKELVELDKYINVSRAEFVRSILMKEARKVIKQHSKG